MDEYHGALGNEGQIGFAWNLGCVERIAKSAPVQGASDEKFWFRIRGAYA